VAAGSPSPGEGSWTTGALGRTHGLPATPSQIYK